MERGEESTKGEICDEVGAKVDDVPRSELWVGLVGCEDGLDEAEAVDDESNKGTLVGGRV